MITNAQKNTAEFAMWLRRNLTNENTADASFCDSPYHLSVRDDTWRLRKRQPEVWNIGCKFSQPDLKQYFENGLENVDCLTAACEIPFFSRYWNVIMI